MRGKLFRLEKELKLEKKFLEDCQTLCSKINNFDEISLTDVKIHVYNKNFNDTSFLKEIFKNPYGNKYRNVKSEDLPRLFSEKCLYNLNLYYAYCDFSFYLENNLIIPDRYWDTTRCTFEYMLKISDAKTKHGDHIEFISNHHPRVSFRNSHFKNYFRNGVGWDLFNEQFGKKDDPVLGFRYSNLCENFYHIYDEGDGLSPLDGFVSMFKRKSFDEVLETVVAECVGGGMCLIAGSELRSPRFILYSGEHRLKPHEGSFYAAEAENRIFPNHFPDGSDGRVRTCVDALFVGNKARFGNCLDVHNSSLNFWGTKKCVILRIRDNKIVHVGDQFSVPYGSFWKGLGIKKKKNLNPVFEKIEKFKFRKKKRKFQEVDNWNEETGNLQKRKFS